MLLLLLLLVLLLLCCCWSCTARELTRAEREVVEVVFKQKLPLALQTEQRCRMLAKRKDPTFSASVVSSSSLLFGLGCQVPTSSPPAYPASPGPFLDAEGAFLDGPGGTRGGTTQAMAGLVLRWNLSL